MTPRVKPCVWRSPAGGPPTGDERFHEASEAMARNDMPRQGGMVCQSRLRMVDSRTMRFSGRAGRETCWPWIIRSIVSPAVWPRSYAG